jgi:hypothetical protein
MLCNRRHFRRRHAALMQQEITRFGDTSDGGQAATDDDGPPLRFCDLERPPQPGLCS